MTERTIRTIGLFGLFGVDNLGNDATLAATIHALKSRLPNARLILVSDPPNASAAVGAFDAHVAHDLLPVTDYLRWIKPYWIRERVRGALQRATEPLRRFRTRKIAKQIDLLLIAGTGIADDYYQGPYDVPHDLLRWCAVVRGAGGLVRFASIGAGPVTHPLSIRWFRTALNIADYRSYRDHSSQRFALRIGVPAGNDLVLPDMVFSLPVPSGLKIQPRQWPPRTIGIGVMGYFGWNVSTEEGLRIYAKYIRKMRWLLSQLFQRKFAVRLLVGARKADQRAVDDILNSAEFEEERIGGRLGTSPATSYIDVFEEIAKTDFVIATRFHNVLFGLLLQRPCISIEYGPKNTDLMTEMGFAEYCHSIETFDPAVVLQQFERQVAMTQPPLDVARARLTEYRELLGNQYDSVVKS